MSSCIHCFNTVYHEACYRWGLCYFSDLRTNIFRISSMSLWSHLSNTSNGSRFGLNGSEDMQNITLMGISNLNLNENESLDITIATWMTMYIAPVLLFIAVFGNLLAFVVFSMPPYRQSLTAVLLRILAVVDTMIVVIHDGLETLALRVSGVNILTYNTITCKIFAPLYLWFRACSAWVLVIIAMERFIGILFPHRAKVINTRRRFGCIIFAVATGLLTIHAPLFVSTVRVSLYIPGVRSGGACKLQGDPKSLNLYFQILTWAILFVTCVLPFVFIITLNITIVYTLIKRRMEVHNSRENGSHANNAAAILISVSLTFIILTLPHALYLILQQYFRKIGDLESVDDTFVLLKYATICDSINHSINIVLYCLCGRKFRQCLWNMMCCVFFRRGSNIRMASNPVFGETGVSHTDSKMTIIGAASSSW